MHYLIPRFWCVALLLTTAVSGGPMASAAKPVENTSSSINVRACGAVGNGTIKDTKALQRAVDACAAKGGGTVYFPAGTYLSAPIFLRSNVTIHLDSGAKLLGCRDWEEYPTVKGRWEGVEMLHKAALITGVDLENVTIEGRGVIDGQGDAWWGDYKNFGKRWKYYQGKNITAAPAGEEKEFAEARRAMYPRPRLVNLINCKNVSIRGITLQNSPSWTLHPVYCENVVIDGLTIKNPDDSPNTDGINPDSCRYVRISNCNISVGDDCITIKSGKGEDGRRVNKPCEKITITNCILRNGHGGVVIGSEMSGGVKDVAVANCVFEGTERAIRFKTARGRGGIVENISYSNLVMRNMLKEAIAINMAYEGGVDPAKPQPVTEATPVFRNISIANIRVEGAGEALSCVGLPEMPVSGISLSNIFINASKGMNWASAKDIDMENVEVNCLKGPALTLRYSEALDVSNFKARKPTSESPMVLLEQMQNAWLRGCRAPAGLGLFLQVQGKLSENIFLSGNDFRSAKNTVSLVDASNEAVRIEN